MKLFLNTCLNSSTDSLHRMRVGGTRMFSVMAMAAAFVTAAFMGSCSKTTTGTPGEEDLTQFVNPMIGTDFTGNTYPGAQVPFGMVQLSPDNGLPGWDRISGYFYPDSTIAGFSHTHLSGTGAGENG